MIKAILAVLLSVAGFAAFGQTDWTLQQRQDGVSIYTRAYPDSKFKAIRVKCQVQASLARLVYVILDVNTAGQWVYGTKSATLLKQVSPAEIYYYSVVDMPWPLTDRDFIAHVTVTQDPRTYVVSVVGPTTPDYMSPKSGIVRVPSGEGDWVLTPLAGGMVAIDYTLRTDPGGGLPAWLVNLFVTKGPLETFSALQQQLRKGDARAEFIREP